MRNALGRGAAGHVFICPDFPAGGATVFGEPPAFRNGPPSWYGSIITGMTDGSGYQYKRNRYYDPTTGQFTQEDPIGLAGGLNVYGYANGDPASYSDPFGLCPQGLSDSQAFWCNWIEAATTAAGADLGGTFGGGLGALVALPTGEVAAPITVSGGVALGAAGGATIGNLAGRALTHVLFSKRGDSGGASQESGGGLGDWAKQNRLNPNSSTTQNLFNSRGMKVTDFISKFRKGSIREVFPSEFFDKTVDEALRAGGSTVRKLLVDGRFVR